MESQFTFSKELEDALKKVKGKKEKDLFNHLTGTGKIAEYLVKRVYMPTDKGKKLNYLSDCQDLKRLMVVQAYLHDLGKLDKRFQEDKTNNPDKPSALPHALFSLPLADKLLQKLNLNCGKFTEALKAVIMISIATHHSMMQEGLYKSWKYRDAPNYHYIQDGYDGAYNLFSKYSEIMLKHQTRDWRFIYSLFNGLLRMADWLDSSGNDPQDIIRHFYLESNDETKTKVCDYLRYKKFVIRDYQKEAAFSNMDSAFMKLPTGDGKTETALLSIPSETNKVIYTLPTITSVEAMRKRFETMFGKENVSFSHHLLLLSLYEEGIFDEKERLYDEYNIKKYVVTTIDKILLSLVNYGNYPMIEYSLNNSYLIVDEIHSYSPYTLSLILHSLEYLKEYHNTKILVMSATLPNLIEEELKKRLGSKPLLKQDVWENRYRSKRRVKIHICNGSFNDNLDKLVEIVKSKKHSKILLVLNTVDRAKETYKKLKELNLEADVFLIHARFIHKDKLEKYSLLENLSKSENFRKPLILVSTQVVEVSLDIDFDIMFTELSPLDSLIQRFGRVNRYGNKGISDVYVCGIDGKYLPYEEKQIDETKKIMTDMSENGTFENELDFIYANNKYYDRLKDVYEREFGKNPLEDFSYIHRVDFGDELLKTRDRFISVPVVPVGDNDEIYNRIKLIGSDQKCSPLQVRIEIIKNIVEVPIYIIKGNSFTDKVSKNYGVIFLKADYSSETGIELKKGGGLIF